LDTSEKRKAMNPKYRILVTSTSFSKVDPLPMQRLRESGCEVVENPLKRPLRENELRPLLGNVDGVIAGLDEFTRGALTDSKRLKVISRYGVGVDNVDLKAAKDLGIKVVTTPEVNTQAVADLTFGLVLALSRMIPQADQSTKSGNWGRYIGRAVHRKVLGIVGLGRIGKAVAERAKGFSMRILAYDIREDHAFAKSAKIEYCPLDTLVSTSDFISLHCDLNPRSKGIIGARELNLMKKTAYLINTARGGLIEEESLYEVLRNGKIAGAGLDVYLNEPPQESPLLSLDNIIATPHIGSYTHEALLEMGLGAVDNLIRNLETR